MARANIIITLAAIAGTTITIPADILAADSTVAAGLMAVAAVDITEARTSRSPITAA